MILKVPPMKQWSCQICIPEFFFYMWCKWWIKKWEKRTKIHWWWRWNWGLLLMALSGLSNQRNHLLCFCWSNTTNQYHFSGLDWAGQKIFAEFSVDQQTSGRFQVATPSYWCSTIHIVNQGCLTASLWYWWLDLNVLVVPAHLMMLNSSCMSNWSVTLSIRLFLNSKIYLSM